jgi:hypothetical protein
VQFTVERLDHGRYIRVGPLPKRVSRAGINTVAFAGRLAGKALRPGRYRLSATAADASGTSTDRATLARFTVVVSR